MKRNASKGFRDLFLHINHYRIAGVALLSLLVSSQFSCRPSVSIPAMAPELTLADLKFEDAEEQQQLAAHHIDTVFILSNNELRLRKRYAFDTVGHIYYDGAGRIREYFLKIGFGIKGLKNTFESNGLINFQIMRNECTVQTARYDYIFDPDHFLLRKLAVYDEAELPDNIRAQHKIIYTGDSVIYKFDTSGRVIKMFTYLRERIPFCTDYSYNASGKLSYSETKAIPLVTELSALDLLYKKSDYYYEQGHLCYVITSCYYPYGSYCANTLSRSYYDANGLKIETRTAFDFLQYTASAQHASISTDLFINTKRKSNL